MPEFHPNQPGFHSNRFADRPMLQGRFGMHIQRNRIPVAFLPVGGAAPVDVEQFIDNIDLSEPQLPSEIPCSGPCTAFGSMSIGNDGTFGTAWNYQDAPSALAAAQQNCLNGSTNGQCSAPMAIFDSQWAAGVLCDNGAIQQGLMSTGNDSLSAITNVYRSVAQQGNFDATNECALIALISANGQQQGEQQPQQSESAE